MNRLTCLAMLLFVGIEYGWRQYGSAGETEYILQVDDEIIEMLEQGHPISSTIPPEVRNVRRIRIQYGTGPVDKPQLNYFGGAEATETSQLDQGVGRVGVGNESLSQTAIPRSPAENGFNNATNSGMRVDPSVIRAQYDAANVGAEPTSQEGATSIWQTRPGNGVPFSTRIDPPLPRREDSSLPSTPEFSAPRNPGAGLVNGLEAQVNNDSRIAGPIPGGPAPTEFNPGYGVGQAQGAGALNPSEQYGQSPYIENATNRGGDRNGFLDNFPMPGPTPGYDALPRNYSLTNDASLPAMLPVRSLNPSSISNSYRQPPSRSPESTANQGRSGVDNRSDLASASSGNPSTDQDIQQTATTNVGNNQTPSMTGEEQGSPNARNGAGSPLNDESKARSLEEPEGDNTSPWAMTFFLLCVSLGANVYLGWIARGSYLRYRDLADQQRRSQHDRLIAS